MKTYMIVLALSMVVNAQAGQMVGTIQHITDGDTLTVNNQVIRFAHIDAWECGQAGGQAGLDHLRTLIRLGDQVTVEYQADRDKYGRLIGTIIKDGLDINFQMVKDGYALWYYKYSEDQEYKAAQDYARNYKRGVWSTGFTDTPWDYRHNTPWNLRKNQRCQ